MPRWGSCEACGAYLERERVLTAWLRRASRAQRAITEADRALACYVSPADEVAFTQMVQMAAENVGRDLREARAALQALTHERADHRRAAHPNARQKAS